MQHVAVKTKTICHRAQAELKLLSHSTPKLNSKYPSDVVYYIKNMLKIDVKTVRTANGSVYMLPEQFQKYHYGLAEEKNKQEAAKTAAAKESLPQALVAQVVARAGSPAATGGTA